MCQEYPDPEFSGIRNSEDTKTTSSKVQVSDNVRKLNSKWMPDYKSSTNIASKEDQELFFDPITKIVEAETM